MHHFITEESDTSSVKNALHHEIREFNRKHLGDYQRKPFSLHQHDADNKIIAGVCGFIIEPYHTMRLEFVWVDEAHRKQGLGGALLKAAERFAVDKQCKQIQINTMAFQAPAFYQKMGYEQIGCAPKWFCGQDELFFIKYL
jgi:GNAT superfamily N-acetyltransferase